MYWFGFQVGISFVYDGVCCDKRSVGRVCKVVGCCWLLVGTIESVRRVCAGMLRRRFLPFG